MAQTKFVCCKDAEHNLTRQVWAEVAAEGVTTVQDVQPYPPPPWEIVIACPFDAVDNWFSSSNLSGDDVVRGIPPGAVARSLVELGTDLGPKESLSRVADSAKMVLDRIGFVALALGGFGILTDAGGGFDSHPVIYSIAAALAGLAVLIAIWAQFLTAEPNFNSGKLNSVKARYEKLITWRTRLAQVATLVFAASIIVAFSAFLLGADAKKPQTALSASFDGSGDHPVLDYSANLKQLPKGATASLRLIGLRAKDATTGKELAVSSAAGEHANDGELTLENKFLAQGYVAYRIVTRVEWGKKDKHGKRHATQDSATVTPVAAAAPAAMAAAGPQATLRVRDDGSGASPVVDYGVDLKQVPKDADTTLRLIGLNAKDATTGKELALTSATGSHADGGALTLEGKFVPTGYVAYRIIVRVEWGKRNKSGKRSSFEDAATVTPTPVAPVPVKPGPQPPPKDPNTSFSKPGPPDEGDGVLG